MRFMKFEKGTILIVATIAVVLLSAISASLILQIQADSNYTRFTRTQSVLDSLAKGAIYDGIRVLNLDMTPTRSGNIGIDTWRPTPAFDVGMDGVPGTNDEGENDGYPDFARPGDSRPGEPGGNFIQVSVDPTFIGNFSGLYAVYDEHLGTNGKDDNNDDDGIIDEATENFSEVDDLYEAGFRRIYATVIYDGKVKKTNVLLGSSNATTTIPTSITTTTTTNTEYTVSETFFKAIYAGNTSSDPNYYLDMGGSGKNGDSVVGDVFINGDIRLSNASFMWKAEDYTDSNGNGIYDFGEPVNDVSGQEPGFLNFGTEGTGDINLRSTISSSTKTKTNWKNSHPTIGGSPAFYNPGADNLPAPDFSKSLDAVTIDVAEEIDSKGTAYTLNQSGSADVKGVAVQDVDNPTHLFMKANGNQLSNIQDYYHASYVNNGLPNFILKDTTTTNVTNLYIAPNGNNQVYLINGNLLFGMDGAVRMNFVPAYSGSPTNGDPLRVTFLVKGNVVLNDDFVYRDSSNYKITDSQWNPYDDAFALVALKNEDAPTNSGNIAFSDSGSGTFERMDGFLYAENDFVSNYGMVDANGTGITINGMMAAGNHVRINQEFLNGDWRARPDSQRNRYFVNFDTRIRSLVQDNNWLPGLPGGVNRTMPVIEEETIEITEDFILEFSAGFLYDHILAWN